MNRQTLDILYRYRHLVGENRDRTARLLKASVLYFASPASFNDPFDCRVHYSSSGSVSSLRRKAQSLYKKFIPALNRTERRRRAAEDTKRIKGTDLSRGIANGLQSDVERVGVLCLSEYRDDVVLWSHYAAGHTGLCLGFRVGADATFFARAQPVCYSASFPSIDLQRDPPMMQVEAFLLTKAEGWAYEREWRIIDHDGGPGEKAFHPNALCELMFGARMTDDDKGFVRACLAGRQYPVSLLQAQPVRGSYALATQAVEP